MEIKGKKPIVNAVGGQIIIRIDRLNKIHVRHEEIAPGRCKAGIAKDLLHLPSGIETREIALWLQ